MRVRIEADPSRTSIEPPVHMRDGLRVFSGCVSKNEFSVARERPASSEQTRSTESAR